MEVISSLTKSQSNASFHFLQLISTISTQLQLSVTSVRARSWSLSTPVSFLVRNYRLVLATNSQISSLYLGDKINVIVDYGKTIDDRFMLKITSCNLVTTSQSFPLISNGTVNTGLHDTSLLTSLPNNEAGFGWKVFSIARSNMIQIDCSLTIEVNSVWALI